MLKLRLRPIWNNMLFFYNIALVKDFLHLGKSKHIHIFYLESMLSITHMIYPEYILSFFYVARSVNAVIEIYYDAL